MFGRRARKPADPRVGERQEVAVPASLRLPTGQRVPIQIEDLSAGGFRAIASAPLKVGMLVRVTLPTGRSPHVRIAWIEADRIGCAFLGDLDPEDLAKIAE